MPVDSKLMAATVEPPLLAELIRSEVIACARTLKTSLEHLERMQSEGLVGTTLSSRLEISTANQQAATLLDRMEKLAGLAETYTGESEDNRERFFLFSLTSDIVKSKLGVPAGRFILKEPDRQVGPLYGNRRWLELMLTHLLHELDRAIHPTEQRIALTLRQLGNHIIMRAQNETVPPLEPNREQPAVMCDESLTLGLCSRIAELHGGTLCLDTDIHPGADELTGFVLSLPTSSPQAQDLHRCADCPLIGQSEYYAADLAELIDRCQELEQTRSANDGQTVNR